jgi:hypothetical protein
MSHELEVDETAELHGHTTTEVTRRADGSVEIEQRGGKVVLLESEFDELLELMGE